MKTGPSKFKENRLQKRAAGTRKRLKEAALDIFSEKSVHAVTVEEITEKAGFVFGFFLFAMIGMTSKEIEISIKPLMRVFVKSLVAFPGR
ncbi:MAG TPA: hypothetical protein VMX36_10330 [Sedimentisphaerales bacterium]|nr:hypothetical protein [Sedimentisphaerales bacterium]